MSASSSDKWPILASALRNSSGVLTFGIVRKITLEKLSSSLFFHFFNLSYASSERLTDFDDIFTYPHTQTDNNFGIVQMSLARRMLQDGAIIATIFRTHIFSAGTIQRL